MDMFDNKPKDQIYGVPADIAEFVESDPADTLRRLSALTAIAKKKLEAGDPQSKADASGILEIVSYRLSMLQSDFD